MMIQTCLMKSSVFVRLLLFLYSTDIASLPVMSGCPPPGADCRWLQTQTDSLDHTDTQTDAGSGSQPSGESRVPVSEAETAADRSCPELSHFNCWCNCDCLTKQAVWWHHFVFCQLNMDIWFDVITSVKKWWKSVCQRWKKLLNQHVVNINLCVDQDFKHPE